MRRPIGGRLGRYHHQRRGGGQAEPTGQAIGRQRRVGWYRLRLGRHLGRIALHLRKHRLGVDKLALLRRLHEGADQAQRTVPALPPVAAADRHARVVESDPCADDQRWAHQHEPGVGVVLRGAGLAGEIALQAPLAADRRAGAGLHRAAHHVDELFDQALFEHALGRARVGLEHAAVAIGDLRHQQRRPALAERGQRGVGAAHLEQAHGARAEGERGHQIELGLAHAGGARELGHGFGTDLLHDLRGDRVLRLHQALAHRHRPATRAAAVGRLPAAAVGERDVDRAVEVAVLGRDAALHCRAIDEGLEGRARLALRLRDVVELLAVEVGAADPRAHRAAGRLDRDEAGRKARLLVAQAVHRVGVGQRGRERLGLALPGLARGAKRRRVARHVGQHRSVLAPEVRERHRRRTPAGRCGLDARGARPRLSPLVAGHALQQRGLLHHRVLREALQPGVERGADHQPVGVEIDIVRIGPLDQLLAHVGDEVARLADVAVFGALERQHQRRRLEQLVARWLQVAVLDHLRHHQVAALARALGVAHRVVALRALEHADERGALRGVELRGRLVEVGACRHLDAAHVVEKRRDVQVALQNLLLAAGALQAQRGDRLAQLAVQARLVADFLREEVARELLGQCRAALKAAVQDCPDRADDARRVEAAVLVEAVVLGRDQRVDQVGRHVFERHGRLVGGGEAPDHLAVGRDDDTRAHRLRAAQLVDGRRREHQHAEVHRRACRGADRGQPGPLQPARQAERPAARWRSRDRGCGRGCGGGRGRSVFCRIDHRVCWSAIWMVAQRSAAL